MYKNGNAKSNCLKSLLKSIHIHVACTRCRFSNILSNKYGKKKSCAHRRRTANSYCALLNLLIICSERMCTTHYSRDASYITHKPNPPILVNIKVQRCVKVAEAIHGFCTRAFSASQWIARDYYLYTFMLNICYGQSMRCGASLWWKTQWAFHVGGIHPIYAQDGRQ